MPWRAVWVGDNAICLPIGTTMVGGGQKNRKKEAFQPIKPPQVGQRPPQMGEGKMRKHGEGDGMGDCVRNARKCKNRILNKLRGIQPRRIPQLRSVPCQKDLARGIRGPIMPRLQIGHSLAPEPKRTGADIQKMMMR